MPNPFRCAKECQPRDDDDHVSPQRLHLEGWRADAGCAHSIPEEVLVESEWQGWLLEWEERQRRQLEHHQEVMQTLVERMSKEHSEGPKKPLFKVDPEKHLCGPALRPRFAHVNVEPMEFMQQNSTMKGEMSARSRVSDPEQQHVGGRRLSKHSHFSASYTGMNQAMFSAVGGAKMELDPLSASFITLESHLQRATTFISEKASSTLSNRGVVRTYLLRLTRHRFFYWTSSALIALYTVVVGVMADQTMKAALAEEQIPEWKWYIDFAFSVLFTVEVVLRIMAEGLHFFTGHGWSWNVFDCCVASVGLLDILSVFHINLGFLRVLRTIRAAKVWRVIRAFPVFKELRLMIASILACLVSLTWAFLLLSAVVYIFAVILLQGASDSLLGGSTPSALRKVLAADFGSLTMTVYSLTQACTGGRSWGEYAEPFIQINPWYGVSFTLFVLFVMIGVMNILTGLFVENTCFLAKIDKELVLQEAMSQQQSVVNQIRQLFTELDADGSGTLTFTELQNNLDNKRVQAYFSLLQLDVTEAQGLFQLLDRDETGEVSIDEFIMSCMRLRGTARSIDLAAVLFENKRLYTMMKTFMQSIDGIMVDLKDKFDLLALS